MRKVFSLLLFLSLTVLAKSQMQIGVFGGLSDYVGDITEKPYQNSRPAFGLTAGYQISDRINLRAGVTLARVAGADSFNTQEDLRLRNLSFQSNITEFSLVGEFNTLDMRARRWSPYLFGGVAVYHFNPYTFDQQNQKLYLQPLSTEGEGLKGYPQKPYALTQLALPFGGGIKYAISPNLRIALEVGMRKLFTDYLDDVSGNYPDPNELFAAKGQEAVDLSYREDELPFGDPVYPQKGTTRGSPKYKDYYYFSGIHLTFLLPDGHERERILSSPAGKNRRYGCPTVF